MVTEIKRAREVDAKVLTDLGRETFLQTFAKDNSQEDMNIYLAKNFSIDKQRQEIQDTKRRIAIAWIGGIAAGFYHLYDGPVDPSVKGECPVELLRLYVDSKWHGKGIGPALMKSCIDLAGSEGYQTMWLGVWERNFKAQAFYKKYLFSEVGKHIFTLGNDEQIDLILCRKI
jgi:GNAT superfamily N-acetyltransferase